MGDKLLVVVRSLLFFSRLSARGRNNDDNNKKCSVRGVLSPTSRNSGLSDAQPNATKQNTQSYLPPTAYQIQNIKAVLNTQSCRHIKTHLLPQQTRNYIVPFSNILCNSHHFGGEWNKITFWWLLTKILALYCIISFQFLLLTHFLRITLPCIQERLYFMDPRWCLYCSRSAKHIEHLTTSQARY